MLRKPKKEKRRKGINRERYREVIVIDDDSSTVSLDSSSEIDESELDEFQLEEAIEGLTQKSAQGRINCLIKLSKYLKSKYVPSYVSDIYLTICDGIKRCLKKGTVLEAMAAAELASIICVQLGPGDACANVCKELKPVLHTTASDVFVNPVLRGKCCQAFALMCFIANSEKEDILDLMQIFETFFSGSFFKDDGTTPTLAPEIGIFHAAALSVWGLFLTIIDSSEITMMMQTESLPSVGRLAQLLESQHLKVRMASGNILAFLYEIMKFDNHEEYDEIVSNLKSLAAGFHEYITKKDRKKQMAWFKDILSYVENDVMPERKILFPIKIVYVKGILDLNSWAKRIQYEIFRRILGTGINVHLAENDFIRDLLEIEDPIIRDPMLLLDKRQEEKQEEKCHYVRKRKTRTVIRGRDRDDKSYD